MNQDLNPSVALDTATALRAAADRRPYPGWFPPVIGIGYAVSLSLMGAGYMIHGGLSRVLGLSGAALLVLTFATMVPVLVGWRRAGVVPKFDACDMSPEQQRRRVWAAGLAAAVAAAGMIVVVLKQWGWIEIAFGLVLGAQTWRRLARRAAR